MSTCSLLSSSELEITLNEMRPRFCSLRAVSSRDACALNRLAFISEFNNIRHILYIMLIYIELTHFSLIVGKLGLDLSYELFD